MPLHLQALQATPPPRFYFPFCMVMVVVEVPRLEPPHHTPPTQVTVLREDSTTLLRSRNDGRGFVDPKALTSLFPPPPTRTLPSVKLGPLLNPPHVR